MQGEMIQKLRQEYASVQRDWHDLMRKMDLKGQEMRALRNLIRLYDGAPPPPKSGNFTNGRFSYFFSDLDQTRHALPSPPSSVAERREAVILSILKDAASPLRNAEIRRRMAAQGIKVEANSFDALMSKLWRQGRVSRPKHGYYEFKRD